MSIKFSEYALLYTPRDWANVWFRSTGQLLTGALCALLYNKRRTEIDTQGFFLIK